MSPKVTSFFDEITYTITHVISDQATKACAIVDAVLDYDAKSGRTSTKMADQVIDYILNNDLRLEWILETHAHADHVTAAPYLQKKLGGRIGIGEHILKVQTVFNVVFNYDKLEASDGSAFDHLFADGEEFNIGNLNVQAINVPGHTPADMAYIVEGKMVFVGDTLFMPDVGTARCDFPGGDAHILFKSIKRIFSLPPDTQLFMCHDYPPDSRPPQYVTTVAEQRNKNIHVKDSITEEEFVKMRTDRDKTLAFPTLILPSIQLNIRAGKMPGAEENGVSYLKIPINGI
ncbi:MBL fold metallo-hydrolase [Methylophilus sp. 14]|uniref:MBL fold metallo-hydrolase n=1 Tax=Methylophilus sp. 14 TaxID=2781019 RepID=UPI00188F6704|nr:MBL fold metallo-hydrolase [Methylophilus sp. 14]MBF4988156.1 MBL fold metallo-hydrolase [Methylophilus sp. 14]